MKKKIYIYSFLFSRRRILGWDTLPICYFIVIGCLNIPNTNCKQFYFIYFLLLSTQFLSTRTFCSWFTLQLNKWWRISANTHKQTFIQVLWKYLHKWGHYLKVVFNYCCGRYLVFAYFIKAPTCFRFRFLSVFLSLFFCFRLACRDFLLLLCYCLSVSFIFCFGEGEITLINYFYQSRKWGQWQLAVAVPISPICLGLVCQLTIRFFSFALCSALLFYVILFGM